MQKLHGLRLHTTLVKLKKTVRTKVFMCLNSFLQNWHSLQCKQFIQIDELEIAQQFPNKPLKLVILLLDIMG